MRPNTVFLQGVAHGVEASSFRRAECLNFGQKYYESQGKGLKVKGFRFWRSVRRM